MAKVKFNVTTRGHGFALVPVFRDGKRVGELHGRFPGDSEWRPDCDLKQLTGDFRKRLLGDAKKLVRKSLSGE